MKHNVNSKSKSGKNVCSQYSGYAMTYAENNNMANFGYQTQHNPKSMVL
jgi:hypothetical protein